MWEIENYRDHAANERTLAAWLQAEFRRAFAAIVQERVDALMVGNAAQFFPSVRLIVELVGQTDCWRSIPPAATLTQGVSWPQESGSSGISGKKPVLTDVGRVVLHDARQIVQQPAQPCRDDCRGI
jgi:hypothetical protein